MLQALLCKKHQQPNDEGVSICLKEDTLTACIFERLRYLPENHLVNVVCVVALRNENALTPDALGKFQNILFWPRFQHPDGRQVEPDLVLEFERLLLIVEAKRWDAVQQQSPEQWEKELQAVSRSHPGAAKKPTQLLAVGGHPDQTRSEAWITSWKDLVKTVKACCPQPEPHIQALIEGMEHSLFLHGIDMQDPFYLATLATTITALNMRILNAYFEKAQQHFYSDINSFSDRFAKRPSDQTPQAMQELCMNNSISDALQEAQKAHLVVLEFNKVIKHTLREFFNTFDDFYYYTRSVISQPRDASPLDFPDLCAIPFNHFSVLHTKSKSNTHYSCIEKGDALISCEVVINESLYSRTNDTANFQPFVYVAALAATEDVPDHESSNIDNNNWFHKIWKPTDYSDHETAMVHHLKPWIQIYTEIIPLETLRDVPSIREVAAGFKKRAEEQLGISL